MVGVSPTISGIYTDLAPLVLFAITSRLPSITAPLSLFTGSLSHHHILQTPTRK